MGKGLVWVSDLLERLPKNIKNKVDFSGECWIWESYKNESGYGRIRRSGKKLYVHRFVWEHYNGPITDGLQVCHKCDVRNCVNPEHLFLGTNKDNMDDKVSKNRQSHTFGEKSGKNAKLTQIQADEIRKIYQRGTNIKSIFSLSGLASRFGVDQSQISRVINDKSWLV